MNNLNQERKDESDLVDSTINDKEKRNAESEFLIVPKVVYGIDNIGSAFIYIKLKDFKSSIFLDEFYTIMYQSINHNEIEIKERMEHIVEWLKKNFTIGNVVTFKDKKHFFIKGKLFRTMEKIEKFYDNIIIELIIDIGAKNINPEILNITSYGKIVGVL